MSGKSDASSLRGNSGCKLNVSRTKMGRQVVRKTSPSTTYNQRLQNQMQFQVEADLSAFRVPEVLDHGFTQEGHFYFDMPFIPGLGLHEAISLADNQSLEIYAATVFQFFLEMRGKLGTSSNLEFSKKIVELRAEESFASNPRIRDALARLAEMPDLIPSASGCHGDFSLENILVYREELYLIDFHDIFYRSWAQDYSKILFDLEIGWSTRKFKGPTRVAVCESLKFGKFKKFLSELYGQSVDSGRLEKIRIEELMLLHGARIIPYANLEWKRIIADKLEEFITVIEGRD